MNEQVAIRPRIRPDKVKTAELFNVPTSSLITLSLRNCIATVCYHQRFTNVEKGIAVRDLTIWLEMLIDEEGTCYAMAAACPCGKVYYADPTVELMLLAEEAARLSRPQIGE